MTIGMPVHYRHFAWSDSARVRRTCVSALGLALLIGCARRSEARLHEIEMVVPTEIVELDPRYATRALDVKASRLVHAGLVDLDPDTLLPRPRVAKSLTLREDRSIVVELKAGVRFHSGHVLESSDVCATLDALKDPRSRARTARSCPRSPRAKSSHRRGLCSNVLTRVRPG